MNKEQLKEVVVDVIRKHSQFGQDNIVLNNDLRENYGIDSIALVDVIVEIEVLTDISIDSDSLTYDNFSTVGAILDYVSDKMQKAG